MPEHKNQIDQKKQDSKSKKKKKQKSVFREWIDAAIFAIIAASIIRTFFFEAYTIPTPSMEKTLLVHDFLFVNKLSYGPRVPMTPLAVPFTMSTVPLLKTRSYSNWPKFGYHRLPGFKKIQRRDVVVFNFPDGDTILREQPEMDYYEVVRTYGREYVHNNFTITTRPTDRKDNYIKRCVGIPGDDIEIKGGYVYVNGEKEEPADDSQKYYWVQTDGGTFNLERLKELKIAPPDYQDASNSSFRFNLTQEDSVNLRKFKMVKSITRELDTTNSLSVFPHDPDHFDWASDKFGPVHIPQKGETVDLSMENIAIYERIIKNYEGNEFEIRDSSILINGEKTNQYTFKMDYYWMMGDNRDNSLDSRYWGFVPEDHVVGKAWFIWMSYGEDGIRWRRIFKGIR